MKAHRYKGFTILPTSGVTPRTLGWKWYVQQIHPGTGIPWDESASVWFQTLKDAREWISRKGRDTAP